MKQIQNPRMSELAPNSKGKDRNEFQTLMEKTIMAQYVMALHSYDARRASISNFFEVPCWAQKVVKFKGRINGQLPNLVCEARALV